MSEAPPGRVDRWAGLPASEAATMPPWFAAAVGQMGSAVMTVWATPRSPKRSLAREASLCAKQSSYREASRGCS